MREKEMWNDEYDGEGRLVACIWAGDERNPRSWRENKKTGGEK